MFTSPTDSPMDRATDRIHLAETNTHCCRRSKLPSAENLFELVIECGPDGAVRQRALVTIAHIVVVTSSSSSSFVYLVVSSSLSSLFLLASVLAFSVI